MHPCILNLPNSLFYENKISSGYVHKDVNFFIDKEKPLRRDAPKINVTNENLESINDFVDKLINDDEPITKKKKKITMAELI